jgi:anaerobic ribonucleoside-triphosphate reductase activating protein
MTPIHAPPVTQLLRLGAVLPTSVVNGPGERYVLWVQGCPLRCRGCSNPGFLPFRGGFAKTVTEMAETILATPGIEGVTYSGGEPTAQAEALYHLGVRLRSQGLTVLSYSGYTLEELRAGGDPWVRRLLGVLDVLIDGPYVEALAAPFRWRGSANQRVHFLTDAYRHLESEACQPEQEMELVVGHGDTVATGILHREVLARLDAILKEPHRE